MRSPGNAPVERFTLNGERVTLTSVPSQKEIDRLWNCHDQREKGRLIQWTIDTVEQHRAALGEPGHLAHPDETWFERFLDELKRRRRNRPGPGLKWRPEVLAAIEKMDEKRLCKLLAAHRTVGPIMIDELMRVIRKLMPKPKKPGRKKGQPRPNDLPEAVRDALSDAHIYVHLIREVWWIFLGKKKRSEAPTAIEIAVMVFKDTGMTETNLRGYIKNHRRF